jgi:uncharacterized membrane protein
MMIKRILWDTAVGAFRKSAYPTAGDFLIALVVAGLTVVYAGLTHNIPFAVITFIICLVLVFYIHRLVEVFTAIYRLKKISDKLMKSTENELREHIKK